MNAKTVRAEKIDEKKGHFSRSHVSFQSYGLYFVQNRVSFAILCRPRQEI